jgi:hypothetical protein
MTPRIHRTGLWLLAILLTVAFRPTSVLAQAGLSGDPFGGQEDERLGRNSKFDTGFKSKSALGQLEELTGATVDRSSSQSSSRNTETRTAPQPAPVKPRYDPNQAFRQEVAGTIAGAVVGALFADLLNDNSAQQKAAAEAAAAQAAAQAAAEAEAFRVQQELARQARILRAQHYRAEWDAREAEVGDRLGGAFEVGTGTAFFGRPANPDAATVAAILGQDTGGTEPAAAGGAPDVSDEDASVVDLRGSSMVVQPSRPPARTLTPGRVPPLPHATTRPPASSHWAYDLSEPAEPPPPPDSDSQLQELIAYFGPKLGEYYWKTVIQGTAKATLWGRVKNVPGMKALSALTGFEEQQKEGTKELGDAYTEYGESWNSYATNAVSVLANPYSDGSAFIASSSGSMDYQVRKLKVKISEMLFTGIAGHFEMPDGEELKTPEGDYNMVPILGGGAHPDASRLRSIAIR